MSPIQQGLYVSMVGLGILFGTSAIFYLLLIGMQALFPVKAEMEKEGEVQEAIIPVAESSDEKSIVAVIAVALNLAQSQSYAGLGDSLLENHSAWWSAKLISAHKSSRISK